MQKEIETSNLHGHVKTYKFTLLLALEISLSWRLHHPLHIMVAVCD